MKHPDEITRSAIHVLSLVEDANLHLREVTSQLLASAHTLHRSHMDTLESASALLKQPSEETYKKLETSVKAALPLLIEMGKVSDVSPDFNGYGIKGGEALISVQEKLAAAESAANKHLELVRGSQAS